MDLFDELFYQDPYIRSFDAHVVSSEETEKGFEIVLDNTAFYPEGGGQLADTGTIENIPVSDVRRIKGKIIHFCTAPLEVGRLVHCNIDWDRRFSHMQNHTVEHIFSGLIHKKFGYDNVGFHMDDESVTVDFNGPITEEELKELEKETNQAILADIPVRVLLPTAEELAQLDYRSKKELSGQVRIVDVPGCDQCACCGTHVKRSGEIGIFKILSMMKHRGGVRIELTCGLRAITDYENKICEIQKVSELLSAKPTEISKAVDKTLSEVEKLKLKIQNLNNQLFELKANSLPTQTEPLILFEEGLAPLDLRRYCTLLAEKKKAPFIAVLSATADTTYSYVLYGPANQMRELSKTLNQKLKGRGGGNGNFVQGSYNVDAFTIRQTIEELWNQ